MGELGNVPYVRTDAPLRVIDACSGGNPCWVYLLRQEEGTDDDKAVYCDSPYLSYLLGVRLIQRGYLNTQYIVEPLETFQGRVSSGTIANRVVY